MRVYIASKTIHADKWRKLRFAGFPVISTWIDEAGPGETKSFSDLWIRCVREASSADLTIVYAENGEILKGAYIEVGCALASYKPVFAVGLPKELSVLKHPLVTSFETLDMALAAATKL